MHVARHDVDLQLAQKLVGLSARDVRRSLARIVDGNVEELSMLRSIAVAAAGCRCVAGAPPEEILAMLCTAARAGCALWALAENGDVEVQFDTLPQGVHVSGRVDESYLSAMNWLECFWLATLENDQRCLQTLCATSKDLRASSTRTDEHNHVFVEAMRMYVAGDPDAGATAMRALQLATSGPHMLSADWVAAIDLPTIEVAVHVLKHDVTAVDRALLGAFEAHRRYWGVPSRARQDDEWISIRLSALMSMARNAGMPVATTSDYAPTVIIRAR